MCVTVGLSRHLTFAVASCAHACLSVAGVCAVSQAAVMGVVAGGGCPASPGVFTAPVTQRSQISPRGLPSVLARNALVVSFAALVAYSFEVTGYQPFVLTGKTTEGLPPVRIPPFSVTTANGTVSFTEMVQVSGDGEPGLPGGAEVASGPGSVPLMHLLRNKEL